MSDLLLTILKFLIIRTSKSMPQMKWWLSLWAFYFPCGSFLWTIYQSNSTKIASELPAINSHKSEGVWQKKLTKGCLQQSMLAKQWLCTFIDRNSCLIFLFGPLWMNKSLKKENASTTIKCSCHGYNTPPPTQVATKETAQ